ncbi:hypothetical protein MNBD_GAMMA22-1614 [hydrothermal vent metagenome]|uniref:Uncharacterized protein n=1 Tax=hydrothermal vent metagenome TaxID=652676 RepID=A0A3B1APW4_9ZZZZ
MGLPSLINVCFSLKNLKDVISYISLQTVERAMKITSIFLIIYVVLHSIELPVF